MGSTAKYRLGAIFLLVSIIFFLPSTTQEAVAADWVKYFNNPILEPGSSGSWDDKNLNAPSVLYKDDQYKMWYTASSFSLPGARIGHAVSTDGINWEKSLDNPVINVDSGIENSVGEPSVIFDTDENLYKMWYMSESWSPSTSWKIRYATSLDGISWTKGPSPVLTGQGGTWENDGVSSPAVIKTSSEYKMWYSARDAGGTWRIGLATSGNGISWTKYLGNPVLFPTETWEYTASGFPVIAHPTILLITTDYQGWYSAGIQAPRYAVVYASSSNGISWDKPADQNPVLTKGVGGSFDSNELESPFVLKHNNLYQMWYGGYNGSRKSIGYAYYEEPTPSPTPTPSHLDPIILLPGFGASWNTQDLLGGIEKPPEEWYMMPFVKTYDGLIQTLKNAGYETEGENKNLFVFNYNWTKPVESIAPKLKDYINTIVNPPEGTKIDLVGHSLGGLVARTYAQNNPENRVDQLLTLGSPHRGAVKTYYAWEGGDIDKALSDWQAILAGLLLHSKKINYASIFEAVRFVVPGLKNLLPTFPYLKQNGVEKPINQMKEQNTWLANLNSSPPTHLLDIINAFIGNSPNNTLRWIEVRSPNWLDKFLNRWPDGRPTGQEELADGDETVLVESAEFGSHTISLPNINHRGLVETIEGQQAIMNLLGLSPTEIVPAPTATYKPSLIFQLASPANFTVYGPDEWQIGEGVVNNIPDATYSPTDKLIFIPNPKGGNYQARVHQEGGGGHFRLLIGKILDGNNIWQEFEGETTDEPVKFNIPFNENPTEAENKLELLRLAKERLELMEKKASGTRRSINRLLSWIIHSKIRQIERAIWLLERGRENQTDWLVEMTIYNLVRMNQYLTSWSIFTGIDENLKQELLHHLRLAKDYLIQANEI